jgi:arylsulfatase A
MNSRIKITGILVAMLACVAMFNNPEKADHPNIVYILADDLGYGDVSVNNPAGKISTPHIDQLAAEGIRFTDAHSPSSVCTPTRYSILTGRYPWRSRLPVGVLRGYSRTLIEENRPTVASLLKKHGYETGVVGKWHLGLDWVPKKEHEGLLSTPGYGIKVDMNPDHVDFSQNPKKGPNSAGFSYSFILPASLDMPPYCYLENHRLTHKLTGYTEGNALNTGYTGPFWRPGRVAEEFDFYDVLPTFIRQATGFIKRQTKTKPFFLYLPLPAPHTPWVPVENYKGKSKAGEYGDFVQQVDAAVGVVLKSLEDAGLKENTLVIFCSDNGPYWRENHIEQFQHRAAGQFRGMKADVFEGGHRVPFIVRWPKRVKPNTVSSATTTLANLMATCQELVGEKQLAFETEDSYSILSVLLGKAKQVKGQPAVVHSSSVGSLAIRKGDWKLIEGRGSGGFTEPQVVAPKAGEPTGQLYNLASDPGETQDLYQQYPERVKELRELLIKIKESKKKLLVN